MVSISLVHDCIKLLAFKNSIEYNLAYSITYIGYFKIKENPQIFLEPIQRKAKSPNESIYAKDLEPHVHSHHEHNHISDDQVAAAVDAAIKETAPVAPDDLNCYEEAAATVDNVINTTNGNEEVINVQSVVDATQAALAVGQEHVIDPGVQL